MYSMHVQYVGTVCMYIMYVQYVCTVCMYSMYTHIHTREQVLCDHMYTVVARAGEGGVPPEPAGDCIHGQALRGTRLTGVIVVCTNVDTFASVNITETPTKNVVGVLYIRTCMWVYCTYTDVTVGVLYCTYVCTHTHK